MPNSTQPQRSRAQSEANGHNGHDPDPFDTPSTNTAQEQFARKLEVEAKARATRSKDGAEAKAKAASPERCARWASQRYALESLPRDQRWARDVRSNIIRQNAKRDPVTDPPTLMITGEMAVKAGATDEQIAALNKLTNDEIAALRERAAAEREAARMRVRDMARKIAAARDCAVSPPDPVVLTDLLAEPDDAAVMLEKALPVLRRVAYRIVLPESGQQNCIGWAADQPFWLHPFAAKEIHRGPGARCSWHNLADHCRWPLDDARHTMANYLAAFGSLGYRVSAVDPSPEAAAAIEQIALYAWPDLDGCSHAARQLPSGIWTSKLNDLPGIAHMSPSDLEGGQGYGQVVEYMSRPR